MAYCYDYPRPAVTVDAVVFRKNGAQLEVLLIQRKYPPFKSAWCLPGGFMEMEETLEEAVARELEEETGLSGIELSQLGTFSTVDRDPRGRTITVAFCGYCENNIEVSGKDDAADARWWKVDALPEPGFDHKEIIMMALAKLQTPE